MPDPRQLVAGGVSLSLALGAMLAAVTPSQLKPAPPSELQRLIAQARAAQTIKPNTALETAALHASYPEEMVPYSPEHGILRGASGAQALQLAQAEPLPPLPPLPEPDFEPADPVRPALAADQAASAVEITLARAGRTVTIDQPATSNPDGDVPAI